MAVVAAVFNSADDASKAIDHINGLGNVNNVSYVTTENHELLDKKGGTEVAADTGGGAASGAVTGGIIGTLAGLAVANGILPGLGSLFVAGPLATALGLTGGAATTAAGAMTGAAAGGLVGALTGLGIGANDAQKYEERVKEGDTLLIVETNEPANAETALRDKGAIDIATY